VNPALTEIIEAGKDVLKTTFTAPIVEGHPKVNQWPSGLRSAGWVAAGAFALLMLFTLGSGWLRQVDSLVFGTNDSGITMPSLAVPVMTTAVVLSCALAVTATLRAPWWVRAAILALAAMADLSFNAFTASNPLQLAVAALASVALVVFVIVRAFRPYAWWEFPWILGLATAALVGPWLFPSQAAASMDVRVIAIEAALSNLSLLTLPALMVAGFAPAQIVVTGAQSIADRPVSRGLFWTVFGIALAALAVTQVITFLGDAPLTPLGVLASAITLALTAAAVTILVRRAKALRPPEPHDLPEAWGRWVYAFAAIVPGFLLVAMPIQLAAVVSSSLDLTAAAAVLGPISFAISHDNLDLFWRAGTALVALIAAWRFASRNRLTEAVMLSAYGVVTLVSVSGFVAGADFLLDRSVAAMGLVAAVIALVATAAQMARRQFDRNRATGVLTVLGLTVLYPHRDALSDPISVALAVAPAALIIFGLAWRMLTEAQFTYVSSAKFPQSTRVLLYMANSLLAATSVAFTALTRGVGTQIDPGNWSSLGDILLGEPLYVAGLVTGLWLVLRPRLIGETAEQLTDERYVELPDEPTI
jgi:hypothetical protein